MAKAKARTTIVQMVSSAQTGYRRALLIPRTMKPLTMIKYDPIVQRHVLFTESKKRKGETKKPLDFSRGAYDWQKKRK
ncbi:mitochondrial 54S ribosomal protein YmL39 [Martiniozyma asiatica (nom. inval.)]|nr:mitochondrial 54S ribosomal protein YmL39 [Martiniozyma asiatica]